MRTVIFVTLSLFMITACGKYAPPQPPEAFSPKGIQQLEVVANLNSLLFRWRAPDEDLRGKELKSMNGYNVYRKELSFPSDVTDEDVEFELITEIEDLHIEERDKLREAAEAEGKPIKRIKADGTLKQFEFLDDSLKPGHSYLYKIVPFNQGDIEGQVLEMVKVQFRGQSSTVIIVKQDDFADL